MHRSLRLRSTARGAPVTPQPHSAGPPRVSPLSAVALAAIPREVVTSTDGSDWTSLLLERHVVRSGGYVEIPPTPDQTVVVGVSGGQVLETITRSGRTTSEYTAATVGYTEPDRPLLVRRLHLERLERFEKINVFIPRAVVEEAAADLGGPPRPGARPGRHGGPAADPVVQATVRGLAAAYERGAPDLYAQTAAAWLAVHLLTSGGAPHDVPVRSGGLPDRRLAAVVDLLESSFARPLRLDDMASVAQVSKFHFARLFQQATGRSPHAYLVRVRVRAAARLLLHSDLPVSEIASSVGFSRTSYFERVFIAAFDVHPAAYRKLRGSVEKGPFS